MRRKLAGWLALCLCAVFLGAGLVACGGAPPPPAGDAAGAAKDDHERMDANAHVGDHADGGDHHHHHEAPHGGTLILLGDHVGHLELVYDAEQGMLTAYALDGHAEHPVRLTQASLTLDIDEDAGGPALQLVLQAVPNPLTGESVGDTSEFRGEAKALANRPQFKGWTPALHFRGVDCAAAEFAFPEGNES